MIRFTKLFLFVMFMLVAVSCQAAKPAFECQDAIGCVTIAPNEPVKIGVMQDLSGATKATTGLEQRQVIELAVADKDNQLLGHSVELIQADENCTEEGGGNAMLKYTSDPQLVAILGPGCSAAAVGATSALDSSGLSMVSGASVGADLTSIGGQPGKNWHAGFYRTSFNNLVQAQAIAKFAYEALGLRKIGIVNDGDAFSLAFQQAFNQTFTGLGGQIVQESTTTRGDGNMKPMLTSMQKADVEGILNTLFEKQDSYTAYQQITEVQGLDETIFLSTIYQLSEKLVEAVSVQGNAVYFVNTGNVITPESFELTKRYEAKYGKPTNSYYLYGYDSVGLLFKAIEQVAVKDADGTLHIGRQALRDALYNTKNFEGVSGKLNCDEFGDCSAVTFDILMLDGSIKTVDDVKANVVYTYDPQK